MSASSFMQCPMDNAKLVIAERSGVEIDYCPQCRGVWLDRGELDKIIDRATTEMPTAHTAVESSHQNSDNKKRRGSFISDVFGGFGDD